MNNWIHVKESKHNILIEMNFRLCGKNNKKKPDERSRINTTMCIAVYCNGRKKKKVINCAFTENNCIYVCA